MELQNLNVPREVTETRLKSNTTSGQNTLKYLQFCEVLILTPVILAIIGLFSVPTILSELDAEVRLAITWACMCYRVSMPAGNYLKHTEYFFCLFTN